MKRSAFYVSMCYVLWGLLPIYWKLMSDLDPVYILCSRIVWALIFCFIILCLKKEVYVIKNILKDTRLFIHLAVCGIFLTINWGSYIWAVNTGHVLDASLAYFINPIISILLGFIIYREKLNVLQWIAVATAFMGILIPVIREASIPYIALIIGGSFSLYSAFKKKIDISSEASNFTETLAVVPFALIGILLFEYKGMGAIGNLRGLNYVLLPLSGVVTSVPLLFFASGIKNISMSLSGILMYINPTLQFLVGVILYNESLALSDIMTFVFVWFALILFIISNKKDRLK